jgi:hypothetical protein
MKELSLTNGLASAIITAAEFMKVAEERIPPQWIDEILTDMDISDDYFTETIALLFEGYDQWQGQHSAKVKVAEEDIL